MTIQHFTVADIEKDIFDFEGVKTTLKVDDEFRYFKFLYSTAFDKKLPEDADVGALSRRIEAYVLSAAVHVQT